MKASHVLSQGTKVFFRRFFAAIVVVIIAAMSGAIPAQAAAAFSPVTVTAKAIDGSRTGKMSAAVTNPLPDIDVYVARAHITGGTFAGGLASVKMDVNRTTVSPSSFVYSCATSAAAVITVTLVVKGLEGTMSPFSAPCGVFKSVWNQSATITVGAPGSGNASVALTNKSNAPSVYVAVQDDKVVKRYTVPIGENATHAVTGLTPGKTLYVYGIKDGSAPLGAPLASAPILAAPFVPVWKQSAVIHPGPAGSGNADVAFNNTESNQTGGFYVTIGGGDPTSATPVAAGETKSIPVHAEPGTVIRVYGTKDGTAPPEFLTDFELQKAAEETKPDVPPAYTGGNWDEPSHEGTLTPVKKFTYPDKLYLVVDQDGERVDFEGPIHVDGTSPIRATVKAPECGDYDVYFSTTRDRSGNIRWEKHVEQAACTVDTPPKDDTSKPIGVCSPVDEGVYERNILRVATILAPPTDGFGLHVIPPFEYERQGVKRHFEGQNWTPENQALYENGCNPVVVTSPEPDDSENPAMPVTPPRTPAAPIVPAGSPTTGKSAVQSGQPVTKGTKKDVTKTGIDRSKLIFDTGVSTPAASQPVEQSKYWTAGWLAAFALAIAAIVFGASAVRRRASK